MMAKKSRVPGEEGDGPAEEEGGWPTDVVNYVQKGAMECNRRHSHALRSGHPSSTPRPKVAASAPNAVFQEVRGKPRHGPITPESK